MAAVCFIDFDTFNDIGEQVFEQKRVAHPLHKWFINYFSSLEISALSFGNFSDLNPLFRIVL